MVSVRLPAVVGEDRQLTVKVPESIPPGPVDVIIELDVSGGVAQRSLLTNPAREMARAKFAAAGLLSAAHRLPAGTRIPTDEEVHAAGVLPAGARPSEDLIDEDRNEA